MFNRPHHQRIAKILKLFNSDLLQKAECFFAGGTAIVLSLNEYRESLDIDFLCASNEGYRLLRNTVSEQSLGALLREPVKHLREVRADRYGIRTVLEVDNIPIRVELVSEARIVIDGSLDTAFGVPTLCRDDMYAEKLLANADRGLDKSTMSRDIIDLAMMIGTWGNVPTSVWKKTHVAYGDHVFNAFDRSIKLVEDKNYLLTCVRKMHMDENLVDRIPAILQAQKYS
jgi:hypothetical protein